MPQVKKPKIIDAEFTIVGAPANPKPWNGIGVPPNWHKWNLAGKLTYLVLFGGGMWLVWGFAHWLAAVIVPSR